MEEGNKEIKVGIGLGSIKFGMDRDQVKKILGKPNETELFSYSNSDEDLTETWHYDELDLSLGFNEEEDWRLVTISVTAENYSLNGKNIFGLNKLELVNTLKDLNFTDLKEEEKSEESPESELISSYESEMNFWLDNGSLKEVQWGPYFEDEDNIKWPE